MLRNKPQVLRRPRLPAEGLFCNYPHRTCMQNRVDGFEFCMRHILEDKNSPFKQCNYISNKNGKRCPNAAAKADKKDGYCPEHARKAASVRQRASRKRRPKETPETLLEQIEHYSSKSNEPGREVKRTRSNADGAASRIFGMFKDYASSSDSEAEPTLVEQAWHGDADSDAESVDSEQEDPLKHAGVYTAEEVALITRDKLIRLQSLYIEQFKRLQHVMKEKRRKYLHTVKRERETLGSIHAAKEDPEQREKYEKLVAMTRYHKRYGKEALLHRQSKERRIATSEGTNYKPPSYPKCTHIKDGEKCTSRTVPLSKFCLSHILHDGHQTLYQPCCYGDGICQRPVASLAESPFCELHTQLEDLKNRLQTIEETEDEEEEEKPENVHIDVVGDVVDIKMEAEDTPVTEATSTVMSDNTTAGLEEVTQKEEPMALGQPEEQGTSGILESTPDGNSIKLENTT